MNYINLKSVYLNCYVTIITNSVIREITLIKLKTNYIIFTDFISCLNALQCIIFWRCIMNFVSVYHKPLKAGCYYSFTVFSAHQTRRSGWLFRLGFNEIAQFLSKSEVLVALAVFSSQYLFSPIIILLSQLT